MQKKKCDGATTKRNVGMFQKEKKSKVLQQQHGK